MRLTNLKPRLKILASNAESALDADEFRQALDLARKLIKLGDPLSGHFYSCLACLGLRRFKSAKRHAESVLHINPEEPNAWLNLGVVWHKIGNNAMAAKCYNRELVLRPDSLESHFNLARIHFDKRRYRKAFDHFSKCWEGNHCRGMIEEYLAWAAFKIKDLTFEESLLKSILKNNSDDAWALNNFGALLMDKGEYKRAVEILERARKTDKNNLMIMRNLGRALLQLGGGAGKGLDQGRFAPKDRKKRITGNFE